MPFPTPMCPQAAKIFDYTYSIICEIQHYNLNNNNVSTRRKEIPSKNCRRPINNTICSTKRNHPKSYQKKRRNPMKWSSTISIYIFSPISLIVGAIKPFDRANMLQVHLVGSMREISYYFAMFSICWIIMNGNVVSIDRCRHMRCVWKMVIWLWMIPKTPYIIPQTGQYFRIYKYMSVSASRAALPLVTLEDHYIFRSARASSPTHTFISPPSHHIQRYCYHRIRPLCRAEDTKSILRNRCFLLHWYCCWPVQLCWDNTLMAHPDSAIL